jgi:hypothetical protein
MRSSSRRLHAKVIAQVVGFGYRGLLLLLLFVIVVVVVGGGGGGKYMANNYIIILFRQQHVPVPLFGHLRTQKNSKKPEESET